MDKVELGIKLEQINELKQNGDYKAAAKVADTIEWRKVKKWSELSVAEEVYVRAGRPADARNVCVHAYNRNLGGKRLVYTLAELSIQINDLDEAEDLYNEYVEMAPNDMERYVLLYKLNKAKGEPVDRLISILEEYKRNEPDEKYEYELACLYAQAGRTDDCVKECDDLILWFNDGDYVEKALRLKSKYAELTASQKSKLSIMEEYRAAGVQYETVLPDYDEDDENPVDAPEQKPLADTEKRTKDEYEPPEKDYSVYDTQNVQAELAKQMAVILAGEKPLQDDIQPAADLASNMNPSNSVFPEIAREAKEAKEKEIEEKKRAEDAERAEREVFWKPADPAAGIPVRLEEVDEPTKEIRVNTHHWNTFKSTMNENTDENITKEQIPDESGLPKYMTEKLITEGEVDTSPQYIITDIETIIDDNPEVEEEENDEENDGQKVNSGKPAVDLQIPAENSEESAMEGQIDIMDWLEMGDDETDEIGDSAAGDSESGYDCDENPEGWEEDENTDDENAATDEETDSAEHAVTDEEDTPDEETASDEQAITDEKTEPEPEEQSSYNTQDIEEALNRVQEQMLKDVEKNGTDVDDVVESVINSVSMLLQKEVQAAENEESATKEPEFTEEEKEESGPSAVQEENEEPETSHSQESGQNDDEDNGLVLKENEKKYLEKYLFINGLEENVAGIINSKKKEIRDGTVKHGNIAVIGNPKTDKTDFAISLIKAIHADSKEKTLRIAKTVASSINKNGIGDIADKVKNMTLIIENAGQLTKQASYELSEWMETTQDLELVVITGEDFAVKRLFAENEKLAEMFDHRIEIRHYTVNELVAVAKEYARVKGYVIGDKALLKVYLMISEIEGSNSGNEMEEVRNIISNAIERNGKKPKSSRKMIALREKDFISIK